MDLYELYKEISDRNPDKGIEHHDYIIRSGNLTKCYVPTWFLDEIGDNWILTRNLTKLLPSYGLTPQIYYDLVILGLSSPDGRPKCGNKLCDNPVVFLNISSGYREFCSKSCTMVGRKPSEETLKKRSESLTGHEVSESTRRKISDKRKGYNGRVGTHHSEETRKKISESHKGIRPSPLTRHKKSLSAKSAAQRHGVRERISESLRGNKNMLGHKHSEKTRKKLSDSLTKYYERNPEAVTPWSSRKFLQGEYTSSKFGSVSYYSSYELSFLKIVETKDEVVSVLPVPRIKYYNPVEKRYRRYIPDFLLEMDDGSRILIEIKPNDLISGSIVLAKVEAARKYCRRRRYWYMMLTEYDIFSDGNLNLKMDLYSRIRSNQSND